MGNSESHKLGRRYTDRGVKTRQKLVEALLEIVSSDGLQGASVRAITRRAGCNEAILYQHFKNKDQMLREVFAEIMTSMAEDKDGLVKEHPQLVNAIQRWVETTYSFYDDHSDAFAYVLLASPPVVRSPSPLYGRMTKLFAELLDQTKPPEGMCLSRDPLSLNMFRGLLLGVPRAIHFGSMEGPAMQYSEKTSSAILRLLLVSNENGSPVK